MEASLLALVFNVEEFTDQLAAGWRPEWVTHPGVRQMIERRFALAAAGAWQGAASFLNDVENPVYRELLARTLVSARPTINAALEVRGVLTTLRNAYIDRRLRELRKRLPGATEPHEGDYVVLLREMDALRAEKRAELPQISG